MLAMGPRILLHRPGSMVWASNQHSYDLTFKYLKDLGMIKVASCYIRTVNLLLFEDEFHQLKHDVLRYIPRKDWFIEVIMRFGAPDQARRSPHGLRRGLCLSSLSIADSVSPHVCAYL